MSDPNGQPPSVPIAYQVIVSRGAGPGEPVMIQLAGCTHEQAQRLLYGALTSLERDLLVARWKAEAALAPRISLPRPTDW